MKPSRMPHNGRPFSAPGCLPPRALKTRHHLIGAVQQQLRAVPQCQGSVGAPHTAPSQARLHGPCHEVPNAQNAYTKKCSATAPSDSPLQRYVATGYHMRLTASATSAPVDPGIASVPAGTSPSRPPAPSIAGTQNAVAFLSSFAEFHSSARERWGRCSACWLREQTWHRS